MFRPHRDAFTVIIIRSNNPLIKKELNHMPYMKALSQRSSASIKWKHSVPSLGTIYSGAYVAFAIHQATINPLVRVSATCA